MRDWRTHIVTTSFRRRFRHKLLSINHAWFSLLSGKRRLVLSMTSHQISENPSRRLEMSPWMLSWDTMPKKGVRKAMSKDKMAFSIMKLAITIMCWRDYVLRSDLILKVKCSQFTMTVDASEIKSQLSSKTLNLESIMTSAAQYQWKLEAIWILIWYLLSQETTWEQISPYSFIFLFSLYTLLESQF